MVRLLDKVGNRRAIRSMDVKSCDFIFFSCQVMYQDGKGKMGHITLLLNLTLHLGASIYLCLPLHNLLLFFDELFEYLVGYFSHWEKGSGDWSN